MRDRRPALGSGPDDPVLRCWGGRAGEVSRDESGELLVEGEPDTFRDGLRMGLGAGALSDAAACALFAAGSRVEATTVVGWVLVVGVLEAGSADSVAPEMERKGSSLVSVMMEVFGLWVAVDVTGVSYWECWAMWEWMCGGRGGRERG